MFTNNDKKIYKIFSETSLDDDTLGKIFVNDYKVLKRISWLAYPNYERFQDKPFPGIFIDSKERSRVLYLNAFEWASSCMEICCISARNVAMLISKQELGDLVTKQRNTKLALKPTTMKRTLFQLVTATGVGLIAWYLWSNKRQFHGL